MGYSTAHVPITTSAISSPMGRGSDSLPVEVNLFDVQTYLADSMQFVLEYLVRLSGTGVWYLMPSFRGEDADETHLCQFFHSEAEVEAGLTSCLEVAESYLRYLVEDILEHESSAITMCGSSVVHLEDLLRGTFETMTFDDAWRRLDGNPTFCVQEDGWRTLTRAGERELLSITRQPTWVTHWDHLAVPFYQAFDPEDERRALNADLILGLGELIGLGERHSDSDEVVQALESHKVDHTPYDWYVGMKREFPMRTAGFGLGVERFLAWVLQHSDVRDLQLLPRHNGMRLLP